jgi:hypothetical protein
MFSFDVCVHCEKRDILKGPFHEKVCIPRETGVSRLSPLSSSFLAELWRRGEEGGEVVGDGVEMFDICSHTTGTALALRKRSPSRPQDCKPSFFI